MSVRKTSNRNAAQCECWFWKRSRAKPELSFISSKGYSQYLLGWWLSTSQWNFGGGSQHDTKMGEGESDCWSFARQVSSICENKTYIYADLWSWPSTTASALSSGVKTSPPRISKTIFDSPNNINEWLFKISIVWALGGVSFFFFFEENFAEIA